jgi:Eukaryotic elongation factor 5A hypusine, DNA-binding OB fold
MFFIEDGGTKDDLKLPGFPEGFDEQLKSEFEAGKTLVVTVMSAMGHDQVRAYSSTVFILCTVICQHALHIVAYRTLRVLKSCAHVAWVRVP